MSQENLMSACVDHEGGERAGANPRGNMVFEQIAIENVYFKSYLRDEFRSAQNPLPDDLRRARNVAIIVSAFEFIFAGLAAVEYSVRRNRLLIVFTFLNLIFVGCGLMAKLTLSYCGLILHSTYMISIIGGFYIYIMINALINSGKEREGRGLNEQNLNETTIQIIQSLPLLLLFIMGIYSLVLFLKVDSELEAR